MTGDRLPSEWGLNRIYSAGTFVDVNHDGWSDIAVWGESGLGSVEVYVFDSEAAQFRPLGLAMDRAYASQFFGGAPDAGVYMPALHINTAYRSGQ